MTTRVIDARKWGKSGLRSSAATGQLLTQLRHEREQCDAPPTHSATMSSFRSARKSSEHAEIKGSGNEETSVREMDAYEFPDTCKQFPVP